MQRIAPNLGGYFFTLTEGLVFFLPRKIFFPPEGVKKKSRGRQNSFGRKIKRYREENRSRC